jgi:hypothetical protein
MSELLVSVHLVARHSDGSVWIQPIKPDIDPTTSDAREVFGYLCWKAKAEPVGFIRCRQEGDNVQPYHSYFREPATPEHEEAMMGAILRVMADRTGTLNPHRPYQAEAAIEDAKLSDELGLS